jgi:pyruvate ferredoxin oxidoreductase beta subunit
MTSLIAPGHTMCAGCGVAIAVNLISRACPRDGVIVSCATSCLEVTTSAYPTTAWNVPWIHCAFETTSAVASGVEAAIRKLGKPWKVLAIAGDGGTFDIGFQGLSGMLERGQKVTQICVDNECYANTGVQRSGATPFGSSTTTSPAGRKSFGKEEWKKPIAEIVAAHKVPYVASASIAYPSDLIAKVKKSFEKQPSFVHIHCPCPTGWKSDVSQTVNIARLAVETGMWVLYEIEDGKMKITRRLSDRKPVEEYMKLQGRFRHLKGPEIKKIQGHADSEYRRLEEIEQSKIRL